MEERIRKWELQEFKFTGSAVDLARRFVQPWDANSRQVPDGRFIFVNEPLTVEHLTGHLKGELTLRTCLLDLLSQARFEVLDADEDAKFQELIIVAERLTREQAPAYLETSRRRRRLWIFFGQPVPNKNPGGGGRWREIIIYDNELGAGIDDNHATTEIGGGSIVIHSVIHHTLLDTLS